MSLSCGTGSLPRHWTSLGIGAGRVRRRGVGCWRPPLDGLETSGTSSRGDGSLPRSPPRQGERTGRTSARDSVGEQQLGNAHTRRWPIDLAAQTGGTTSAMRRCTPREGLRLSGEPDCRLPRCLRAPRAGREGSVPSRPPATAPTQATGRASESREINSLREERAARGETAYALRDSRSRPLVTPCTVCWSPRPGRTGRSVAGDSQRAEPVAVGEAGDTLGTTGAPLRSASAMARTADQPRSPGDAVDANASGGRS